MKFKVGDKVRVHGIPRDNIRWHCNGNIYTIRRLNPNKITFEYEHRNHYSMMEPLCPYIFYESELELVERKNDMSNFTKSDLKNGDVIKRRNGDVEIVCVDTGTLIRDDGDYNHLLSINKDLTDSYSEYDIMIVRRPKFPCDCTFAAIDDEDGELVYERKEVEEMTLEEVCKALGKEIKIVKEK